MIWSWSWIEMAFVTVVLAHDPFVIMDKIGAKRLDYLAYYWQREAELRNWQPWEAA